MGKIAVYIYNDMADFEIVFLVHMLRTGLGKDIVTISDDTGTVTGKSGLKYIPDAPIHNALNIDLDALIIPGGWSNKKSQELSELIKKMHLEGKLLAAICAGPRYLAEAGVLKGSGYTTSITEWAEEHISRYGEADPFPRETFTNKRVLRDKNIITAQGNAFIDFAVKVCEYYNMFESEEEKQAFINDITALEA